MYFEVWICGSDVLYEGPSWPMARAAIDHVLLEDKGFPMLITYPEPVLKPKP